MGKLTEVRVPDIGGFDDVPVIDIAVSAGTSVAVEDSLITLESDKASMDVPSPFAGVIKELKLNLGDTVSEGEVILTLEMADDGEAVPEPVAEEAPVAEVPSASPVTSSPEPEASSPVTSAQTPRDPEEQPPPALPPERRPSPTAVIAATDAPAKSAAHATPSVRRFARELGVNLDNVTGTGRKGRILRDDVSRFVKSALDRPSAPADGGLAIPAMRDIDFSKFGEVETRPLSRIKQITATNMRRAWLTVPHVTQHDEADITELEAFRKGRAEEAKARGVKLTMVAFLVKASVSALKNFPSFNASLDTSGESLILKHYYHIGIAVDTPEGLVVPVVRDADQKGLFDIAGELGELSTKARDRKLAPKDMQGASFTISSLGGVGGTAFTPIVNAPEVAILGASRAAMKPVYAGGDFVPRLMLPFCISYDHRVIDGAAAARFTTYLGGVLSDLRRLLL